MPCPLCRHGHTVFYHQDERRPYRQCGRCRLVFVPPAYRLSPTVEKAHYDLHDNDPGDPGYRRFLSRLFEPMRERVAPPARGLDFGSGPGPTLSLMFAEAGYDMAIYDPFYAPDGRVLQRTYDFITASEVAEHLYAPGEVLTRLWNLLRPGGWLGLMTKLVSDQGAFANWHYKLDPTHVCFFSLETFAWWAGRNGCEADFIGTDVILLRKPPHPPSAV
ncbi:class I SAM-dependent methyltransferase [Sedimenticola hydrogenitrophicus]|uniref:class I SAM-dependent methyltransferase n=1 Tax=Sedimenticola hydrogenitrophicus TaxID=2967975 RepID=UPI0023B1A583|nr:class I SAM-dependent methyltransferase [Sedimenticola hydrogenitrophicus]